MWKKGIIVHVPVERTISNERIEVFNQFVKNNFNRSEKSA